MPPILQSSFRQTVAATVTLIMPENMWTELEYRDVICRKPQTGFRIAFNMFDTDGNERVDKNEFLVIVQRLILAYTFWALKINPSNNCVTFLHRAKDVVVSSVSEPHMDFIIAKGNGDNEDYEDDDGGGEDFGLELLNLTLKFDFFNRIKSSNHFVRLNLKRKRKLKLRW
ncbi:hypothetical protein ANN_18786 [Periplaneta americana]|uniref:EF-hand domain-containing protein n=1 Tax=Periplaneta americana TaxID=6978 RepID=A0ABQ8SR09_PERAM|nr:hypothetical protein ANN_18786 [Periplaneta americana]